MAETGVHIEARPLTCSAAMSPHLRFLRYFRVSQNGDLSHYVSLHEIQFELNPINKKMTITEQRQRGSTKSNILYKVIDI